MLYFNPQTGQFGITFQDACRAANVSAPVGTPAIGDWLGYHDTNPPVHNPLTHRAVEVTPVELDGELTQQWQVAALDAADRADREAGYRLQLHARIQEWRDQQENGGITHAGHRWDTDAAARNRILSILPLGDNPLGFWTSMDNENVPMDFAGLQALWIAIVQQGAAIHVRQREMKEEVLTLTGDALYNYVIDWPAQ